MLADRQRIVRCCNKRTSGLARFRACLLLVLLAVPVRADQAPTADARTLSESQRRAIAAIRADAKARAAPLAARLASMAHQANVNMLADQPDEALGRRLGEQIRATLRELLDLRLRSIKETVKRLTPAQRALLRTEMDRPGAPADLMELIERMFKLPGR